MGKSAGGIPSAPLRRRMLTWYDANRRDLPWRRTRNPYAIWVSEIMLQQTRVAAVIDRFHSFMERFPTVAALAAAGEQDVLAAWSGLGYYRRARMLHRAAGQVMEEYGGKLPETSAELRKLPGIGPYTSAAIASIAYGEPAAVVDGNVERVLCRVAGWDASEPRVARQIADLAQRLVDPARPGDFNQAMMELGATVCLPRNPMCAACPIRPACTTRGEHKTVPRARMETRDANYALCVRGKKPAVLLEQRAAEQSVMGGMWELPALDGSDTAGKQLAMTVRHAIMQVNYRVRVWRIGEDAGTDLASGSGRRRWVSVTELQPMALTGLARKVLIRAGLMG